MADDLTHWICDTRTACGLPLTLATRGVLQLAAGATRGHVESLVSCPDCARLLSRTIPADAGQAMLPGFG